MEQPLLNVTKHTRVTLKPRKAKLVAVLETSAQMVGYNDKVVLDASKSYDPDRVQVNT